MGSGFSKMKKQARQMQEQYEKMQEEQKNKRVTGTSGNGLVTVTLTGDYKVESIKIKPECIDKDDVEGLEDLIRAAFDEATAQLDSDAGDLSGMLSGMPFSL